MVGYIVPYMEPPISPSTNMEAAFGRLHNSGAGAFGARPTVVESIMVDGEIGGSIYGTIYPTISGSKNGAEIDIILPEGLLNYSGRIIAQPSVVVLGPNTAKQCTFEAPTWAHRVHDTVIFQCFPCANPMAS